MSLESFAKTFDVKNPTFADIDKITSKETRESLDQKGYAVVREALPPRLVEEIRDQWLSRESIKNSMTMKLRLGEANYSRNFFGKYLRHFEFYWNPPTCPLTREVSLLLHYARNILIEFDPFYGLAFLPDHVGIYLALTHYRSGSGEMAIHVDPNYFLPVHYVLPLTFKGKDYREGGLKLHPESGEIDVDEQLEPGSLLLFKGSIPHSVTRIEGRGSKSNAGRLQMFSIPTIFDLASRSGFLEGVAKELYGRLKYGLYKFGFGLNPDHKNFR